MDVGGSPLYGYDVFVREKSTEWQKLNEETVFVTHYTAEDAIQAGKCYEFKVEASNHAGLRSNSNLVSEQLEVERIVSRPEVQSHNIYVQLSLD